MSLVQLGNSWPNLSWTVTDINGTPADATLFKLTILAADGTTAVNDVTVTSTSPGIYSYDYIPTTTGRWVARAITTGTNAAAIPPKILNVVDGAVAAVDIDDAKAHLNFHGLSTENDGELFDAIMTATRIVENVIGPITPKTYTETVRTSSGDTLVLSHSPVMSVTSVTSYGGAVIDPATLAADFTTGLLRFAYPYTTWFRNPTTVVYKAGRTEVPPEVRTAILDLVRINWRSQQGGNRSAFDEDLATGPGSYELGFFVPNGVIGTLAQESLPPVVA